MLLASSCQGNTLAQAIEFTPRYPGQADMRRRGANDPGAPFNESSPRATNWMREPAKRSLTVPERSTSPPAVNPATRAAMCTEIPAISVPVTRLRMRERQRSGTGTASEHRYQGPLLDSEHHRLGGTGGIEHGLGVLCLSIEIGKIAGHRGGETDPPPVDSRGRMNRVVEAARCTRVSPRPSRRDGPMSRSGGGRWLPPRSPDGRDERPRSPRLGPDLCRWAAMSRRPSHARLRLE